MRKDEFPLVDKLVNETSNKAVEQAINKIASELGIYISCEDCPFACECKTIGQCIEKMKEWMRSENRFS